MRSVDTGRNVDTRTDRCDRNPRVALSTTTRGPSLSGFPSARAAREVSISRLGSLVPHMEAEHRYHSSTALDQPSSDAGGHGAVTAPGRARLRIGSQAPPTSARAEGVHGNTRARRVSAAAPRANTLQHGRPRPRRASPLENHRSHGREKAELAKLFRWGRIISSLDGDVPCAANGGAVGAAAIDHLSVKNPRTTRGRTGTRNTSPTPTRGANVNVVVTAVD